MHETTKFLVLEFLSVKYHLNLSTLLIFGILSVGGFFLIGVIGLVMGIMPFTLSMATYTFAAGNNGLDHLYTTLSIDRKTVVEGRYIFSITIVALASCIYFLLGLILSAITQEGINLTAFFVIVIGFFAFSSILSFIELPVLFKMGYKRARIFIALLPVTIAFGMSVVMHVTVYNNDAGVYSFMDSTERFREPFFYNGFSLGTAMGLLATVGVWLLILFVSYVVSLSFYIKREF